MLKILLLSQTDNQQFGLYEISHITSYEGKLGGGNIGDFDQGLPYGGKLWRIDSFRAFGKRKFGKLIDQPN